MREQTLVVGYASDRDLAGFDVAIGVVTHKIVLYSKRALMKSIGSPEPTQSSRTGDPLSSLPAFDFYPLIRVVFGPGALARLGELVRELGGTRVLLVTDRGLEAAGHPQRAVQAVRDAGLEVFIFDDVEENPTTRHVELG